MSLTPRLPQEADQSGVPLDSLGIREQLGRLLAHPLFANSRRYPALLAYTVEQTLLGNSSELKERSIGIEVFGRVPSYDSNADPVVRITAGEVRKRLSQYYYDPAHSRELVIELPTGSYVPAFRRPGQPNGAAADAIAPVQTPPAAAPAENAHPASRHPVWRWLRIAGLVAVSLVVGVGIGRHDVPAAPVTNMDRFWEPITAGTNPTTFCLGEPARSADAGTPVTPGDSGSVNPPVEFSLRNRGNLALSDVITLTRTAAALEARHRTFRVLPASQATFSQLREGPIVLIGAFDNRWTLRLTRDLRYGFETLNGVNRLVDRKGDKPTSWATDWDSQHQVQSRDYAIVARIHDRTTGQPVIIAAGISDEGTQAAGELLYNPMYLDSLVARAAPDWEHRNLEAVIETQVIEGHSGPPHVVAVETW